MRHGEIGGYLKDSLIRTVIAATLIIVVVIFAAGPYGEPRQGNSDNEPYPSAQNEKRPKTFWEKTSDDPVATFTAVLALFTFVLAGVSVVQIYFLTKADETGRLAADAASMNAKAAIGAAMPIISLSQILLLDKESPDHSVVGHPPKECVFSINFHNFGQSPAEAISVCIEWAVVVRLPDIPVYKTISPYAPGTFIQPNKQVTNGPVRLKIVLQEEEVYALSEETKFLWIFGCFSFKDTVLSEDHQYRFCAKWQAYAPQPDGTIKPMGFVYDSTTPEEYIKRT